MACYETAFLGPVFTKHEGTARCSAKFRMRLEDLEFVRQFYNKPKGVVRFATGEIYGQGYGWYVIWSREVPVRDRFGNFQGLQVNGALRALECIEYALAQRKLGVLNIRDVNSKEKQAAEQRQVMVRRALKDVAQRAKRHVMPVVVKPVPNVSRKVICIVKNRAVQVAQDRERLVAASWHEQRLTSTPKPASQELLQGLVNRFAH